MRERPLRKAKGSKRDGTYSPYTLTCSGQTRESGPPPAPSVPNFAGIWAEINPKDAAHPMRLKVVQSGARIACYISYTQVFGDRAYSKPLSVKVEPQPRSLRAVPQNSSGPATIMTTLVSISLTSACVDRSWCMNKTPSGRPLVTGIQSASSKIPGNCNEYRSSQVAHASRTLRSVGFRGPVPLGIWDTLGHDRNLIIPHATSRPTPALLTHRYKLHYSPQNSRSYHHPPFCKRREKTGQPPHHFLDSPHRKVATRCGRLE